MQNLLFPRAAVGLLVACVAIAGLSGCMRTTADGRVGGGISLGDRASGGYVTPIDVVTGRYEVTVQDYIWGAPPADGVFDITKTSLTTLPTPVEYARSCTHTFEKTDSNTEQT